MVERKDARMLLVLLCVVHTIISAAAYGLSTHTQRTLIPAAPATTETTTPEERARRESSFQTVIGRELVVVSVPRWVRYYIYSGYAALTAGLVLELCRKIKRSAAFACEAARPPSFGLPPTVESRYSGLAQGSDLG